MKNRPFTPLISLLTLAFANLASAHPGHDANPAGLSGFLHPLTGIDHLLAMLAVGLWAAQLGGKARWLVPLSFVLAMASGGLLASRHLSIGPVEQSILASLFVLGLFIAVAARLPLPAACAIVALFAIFHGYAHVSEISSSHSIAAYSVGFIVATALLHLAGLAAGVMLTRLRQPAFTKLSGGAVALTAIALWIGLL